MHGAAYVTVNELILVVHLERQVNFGEPQRLAKQCSFLCRHIMEDVLHGKNVSIGLGIPAEACQTKNVGFDLGKRLLSVNFLSCGVSYALENFS